MPRPDPTPFWRMYWEALSDPLLLVLLVCAFVSLGIELNHNPESGWIDSVAILAAIQVCGRPSPLARFRRRSLATAQIVCLVTAGNNYNKERKFRALNAVKDDIDVKVVRYDEPLVVRWATNG